MWGAWLCTAVALVAALSASAAGQHEICTAALCDSTLGFTEIAYHAEPSHVYIGSPSLLRLPSGELIATADRFGAGFAGAPRNVSVYRDDLTNGSAWRFQGWVSHNTGA